MSASEKIYRIYCFDSALQLLTADEIRASSDEEAIEAAKATAFCSNCEVWHGRTLVAEFEGLRREA
jgi:hypothetical protein